MVLNPEEEKWEGNVKRPPLPPQTETAIWRFYCFCDPPAINHDDQAASSGHGLCRREPGSVGVGLVGAEPEPGITSPSGFAWNESAGRAGGCRARTLA